MSIRKLKTQTLFSDELTPTFGGTYSQIGIKCPSQDSLLVGANAYNATRYDLISLLIVKLEEYYNGTPVGIVLRDFRYIAPNYEVSYIPAVDVILDKDDVVLANFLQYVPGDDVGLRASFRREM